MYLVGRITDIDDCGDVFVREGEVYKIISETEETYEIFDECEARNRLSKDNGASNYFRNWFVLVERI